MIIYFAGFIDDIPFLSRNNVKNTLVSFYELNKNQTEALKTIKQYPMNYFLDSGAYSAFHVHALIDLNEYMQFIKTTESIWATYACLDVIGEPKKTLQTQERMEQEGLHPLPVFHVNSPLSMLHDICKTYDYFALGGLVPYSKQRAKMRQWCDTCFSVIKQYWPKKVHAFGINSSYIIERYPWYSVDATSWKGGGRWGHVQRYVKGKVHTIKREEDPGSIIRFGTWKHRGQDYIEAMMKQNIITLLKLEKYITELWQQKGISWTN